MQVIKWFTMIKHVYVLQVSEKRPLVYFGLFHGIPCISLYKGSIQAQTSVTSSQLNIVIVHLLEYDVVAEEIRAETLGVFKILNENYIIYGLFYYSFI